MKRLFSLWTLLLMAVMGAWADIAVLSTPSESLTTLSDANGIVTITDASGSTGIQQGSGSYKITYDGTAYVPMKLSGSRNFTLTFKEGVTINSVTLLAMSNGDAEGTVGAGDGDATSLGTFPARNNGGNCLTVDITGNTGLRGSRQFLALIVVDYTPAPVTDPVINAVDAITIRTTESGKDTIQTLNVEGTNLSGSTLTATLNPAVSGLSVALASSTIADGAITTTATLTYNATENAKGTTTLTLSDGTTSKAVTVNYAAKVVYSELQPISEATTWDFGTDVTYAGTTDFVSYDQKKDIVYADFDELTFAESFNASALAFQGQFPFRSSSKKFAQNGILHFKTTVPGTIKVKFTDTGSGASADAVKRYLMVNGEQTEYWTSRENNGTDPYAAQLNVETGEIAVPAGDVTISGSSAICVSYIIFTPTPQPEGETVTFDFAANEWEHALGSGTGETADAGNVDELTKDNVTVLFKQAAGSTHTRYWTGPQIRLYSNNIMKVIAPEGKAVTKIEFTASGASYFGLTSAEAIGTLTETVWTGNSTYAKFTATKTNRLTKMVVTLADTDENTIDMAESNEIVNLDFNDPTIHNEFDVVENTYLTEDIVVVDGVRDDNDKIAGENRVTTTIPFIPDVSNANQNYIRYSGSKVSIYLRGGKVIFKTEADKVFSNIKMTANVFNAKMNGEEVSKDQITGEGWGCASNIVEMEVTGGTNISSITFIIADEYVAPVPPFNPATAIANADFEADEPIANKVCTYAKDVQEGQVANMQPVTGWTIVENGDARAAGTFAYGSTAILGGDGGNVPAAGPNGETEGKALGLEAVWSATTQYTQDITLPAGEYLFEAVIYNAAGTGALESNLIGIDGNYLATKSYPVGKWTKDQVKFTLAEEKTVTVSLGVNSGNVGNGAAPHLFIDHVKLYGSEEIAAQELAAAKENALATIDALPIGDALFLYNEAAIQAAKADVNTAETIEAVNTAIAAARAAQNKPAADKEYVITNKTAQLALSITTEAVKIEKEGAVKFTEVEGGWVLSNTAETPEYIFKTTGNTWTLSTTTTKDEAYKVNFNLVDGAYTIQGANGLFGTDNATEGSAVYANKAQANNGLWTIAEKPAEPEFQPAYGTLWTDAQGSQVDENQFNFITLENKYFNGLVKEGDTIKVAISHVGNQPSSRARIITEGTLNLTIDNAGESKTIQQDMTSADLVLDADEIANIQNGANVVLSWKNMTVAQVDLVEKKTEIDPTLLAEAEGLASDASAVAVGKLLAAIEAYKKDGKAETLQDAMAQFKADNADQVADQTAKVATNGWKKFDGSNAGVCATQFAPAITTYDGRNAQLAESYEEGETAINRTGTIIYQDITGLTNGTYKVGFYGNAFFTSGRGFDSTMEDGADDVAYVFANDQKEFITARVATSTTENNFRQFDVEVTDGTIKLGMGKDKPGTNWHTMQIYQLTWFTTAKELFAAAQVELKASIEAAEALKTGNRTEGLDAFNDAIALAKQGVESNWYNITEIQSMISGLKDAMETFKVANYYKFNDNLVAYVIDAETGKSIAAGHDWGTRGIVNEAGLDLTFETTDNNKVFLNTQVSNGGNSHYLGDNLYMDGAAYAWAFEYVGFGFYITNGTQYISLDAEDNLVLSDTPREWIVVTAEGVKETRLDEMAEATPENPADATFLLQNPNFNRNDQRVAAWVVSDDCTNKNLNGGNNVNNCAESYHSTFTISQTITDAPKGTYELKAQGFYRQDNDATEDAPVFFINDKTTEVPVKTGEEGSMSAASESFTAGLYNCEPVAVFVENGTLTVGVKATGANQWVIFDNFRLTYYGSQNTVGISEVNNNVLNNVKTIYNLNGQKVQKAQKGLYIINGKKTVVK